MNVRIEKVQSAETILLPRSSSVLVPGDTIWRKCDAGRVAVLNDAAEYFGVLREALLLAERQVFIIGWDIHSETPLVGPSGVADDGLPDTLGPFLKALVEQKDNLDINILVWDFAALYARERERHSARKLASPTNRVHICLDSSLPLGSAQHQKFVVIDNSLAFVGGLDLTIRRWDTSEHALHHSFRKDPAGIAYPPFHDVQCMVDGAAARALGELAIRRWNAAGCDTMPIAIYHAERWPDSVASQAENIPLGIARTELGTRFEPPVHEVERLFYASIATAKKLIYIENQFTSSAEIAEALARRMREVPELRVLIVTPKRHASWLESRTMQSGRGDFVGPFHRAEVASRIRMLYPLTRDGDDAVPVMVHSKLMTIDDEFLRIGSSNINNRSMGADTECDLCFEATDDGHRRFIRNVRHRLLAHHCGLSESAIAANEECLLEFLDAHAASRAEKVLLPVDLEDARFGPFTEILQPIADPKEPLDLQRAADRTWTARTMAVVLGIIASLVLLTLAWRHSFLSSYTDVGYVAGLIGKYAQSPLGPPAAVLAFLVGGLVIFPVVVLIAATAAALGPVKGFVAAAIGVLSSATLLFFIGRVLGQERLQSMLGRRALRVQERIIGKGVLAIAMIRMVPVAPFSVVNVLAGASRLRLTDFLIGTAFGMAPGIIAMAALGAQIADFARHASWWGALQLGLIIAIWLPLCLAAQFVVTWLAGRRR
ncbi:MULTISPECIES: VTT domain-containing protein [Bradyrhizobium]|uniref:VTT domain-containing protein n=1 Tax=Bradyrhizobium elkanii TaxID=29448 RepID=UPI000424915B|nr:VTT domain-containing protein [Bradyrhizobium elkanii]